LRLMTDHFSLVDERNGSINTVSANAPYDFSNVPQNKEELPQCRHLCKKYADPIKGIPTNRSSARAGLKLELTGRIFRVETVSAVLRIQNNQHRTCTPSHEAIHNTISHVTMAVQL
jgi:hypothetical protein